MDSGKSFWWKTPRRYLIARPGSESPRGGCPQVMTYEPNYDEGRPEDSRGLATVRLFADVSYRV